MTDFEDRADQRLLAHPEEPILRYFAWQHLPQVLQDVSRGFGELALWMVDTLPRSAERAAGLRKLLEAKDCAVRAALPAPPAYPLIPRDSEQPAGRPIAGFDLPAHRVDMAERLGVTLPEGYTAAVDTTPLLDTRPLVDEENAP